MYIYICLADRYAHKQRHIAFATYTFLTIEIVKHELPNIHDIWR